MTRRKTSSVVVTQLLGDDRIRHAILDGRTYFALPDLLTALADTQFPLEYWANLKQREPALIPLEEFVISERNGVTESVPAVDFPGLMRLVQAIPSAKAERIKKWLAESGVQRLEEAEDPERVLARMRREYEEQGYSRRWIDKRLRGISTRHEVTSEWARRGATDSEQYRTLTNAMMQEAFGSDVEGLRRQRYLQRPSQHLRDAMSDLELTLTSLGETAAVELHRARNSQGFEQLLEDARDAGRIVAAAREQIDRARRTPRAQEPAKERPAA